MLVFREIKIDSVFKGFNFTRHLSAHSAIFSRSALIDGWLRMGLLPLGNFADISYLVEN